jgi:hypothetical protein
VGKRDVPGRQVNEALGLPLEALQYHVDACALVPDYPAARPHAVSIAKNLRDPPTIPSEDVWLRNPQAQGTPAPGWPDDS